MARRADPGSRGDHVPPEAAAAQEAEFDTVARWTVEAVRELGRRYAVPAACRGTGGPRALDWLCDHLGLGRGDTLLDVGGGLGGPAEVARRTLGVRPVVVDVQHGAARAATELFDLAAVCADAHHLPVASRGVAGVWCLGTVCTTRRQPDLLAELARVTRPEGPIGLMVLVATGGSALVADTGNLFPTAEDLTSMVAGAGAVVEASQWADELATGDSWQGLSRRVDGSVRARHGDHPAYRLAAGQEAELSHLLERGRVRRLLLAARRVT